MNRGNRLIFVSIASYRDLQLIPTIEDCILKARHPDLLRFGICWQHGLGDDQPAYKDDDRFRILDVDWRASKGACWARSEIMKLWRGEDWFLQVDSHCRFARDWDERLLHEMDQTASPKPVLGTYASAFTPGDNETLADGPLMMAFQGFTDEGIPHMKPMAIPDWRRRTVPMRARFMAAGFFFAPGSFVEEVRYDPDLYFVGEEATMTLRAFTNGYDLFHPYETLVWHDYVRKDATKHWDDHTEANVTQKWYELDLISKQRAKQILAGEHVESYGLGSVRSLEEYEQYAGLSFHLRKVQDYTVRAEEPPNPITSDDWTGQIYTWMARITMDRSSLPTGALDDPIFWYIGIQDEGGVEIHRKDIPKSQLDTLSANEPKIVLIVEFESGTIPARWSVWPVSRSRGWLSKMEGSLADEDYTMVVDEKPE